MTEIAKIRDGLLDYANARVLPKLEPYKQFIAGTALGLAAVRADQLTAMLSENEAAKALGIVSENGMVDLDVLYDAAMQQIRKQKTLPLDVPLIGRMSFDENDLNELYRYIMNR